MMSFHSRARLFVYSMVRTEARAGTNERCSSDTLIQEEAEDLAIKKIMTRTGVFRWMVAFLAGPGSNMI